MVNRHNWNAEIYKGTCYTGATTVKLALRKGQQVTSQKRRHEEKNPQ
jgi:hypothetical protein